MINIIKKLACQTAIDTYIKLNKTIAMHTSQYYVCAIHTSVVVRMCMDIYAHTDSNQ